MKCAIELCDRPIRRREWCGMHYQRGMKDGTIKPLTATDRFWAKVDKTESCWLWTGALSSGYGTFSVGGRQEPHSLYAHRYAYELFVGAIPDGLHIDHLCRVTRCVRPDHLEPVTPRENVIRGVSPGARAVRSNACARGHEYTEENTLVISTSGRRQCRACNRIRYARKLARRSGAAVAA